MISQFFFFNKFINYLKFYSILTLMKINVTVSNFIEYIKRKIILFLYYALKRIKAEIIL